MSQPTSPSPSRGGSLDIPGARAAGTAPPPDPKVQAVNFAIQLAGVNATATPQEVVTVQKLVDDAQAIATFLGGGR